MRQLLLLVVLPAICAGQGVHNNPFSGDPVAAEAGRAMFRIYCSPCHGIRGEGGRGPDLTRDRYSAGEKDVDTFRTIAEGVPGSEMLSFAASFSDENIWRLVSYLRSIIRREPNVTIGNSVSGEKLFWGKGGCAQCHRVAGRGGRLGPELTAIGRRRSLAYLRESVSAPSNDLTPGYNTIVVITRDGKKITGVQRGFDNFSAQLMDAAENFHSFQKSDVVSIKREFRSLMPDNYGKMFTESELNNLLAYLSSLRGETKQ